MKHPDFVPGKAGVDVSDAGSPPRQQGEVSIRPGRPEDANALSVFAARTFHDAFAADNDPGDMAAYMTLAFSPQAQARELADPENSYLIAESGDTIVGYVLIKRGDDTPECVPVRPSAEISRFYVDWPWHGTDVAPRLMSAAISEARVRKASGIWLGVWEHNVRAVRFYTKYGFRDVGSHTFLLGKDAQTDRVMFLSIES
jgi:diamine N-acetyltransferase